jgi:chemotaxis protein CheD
MAETMVRMGELVATASAGDVLVSLGLGSCIGLALLDRRVGVAGLAHVVLPDSDGHKASNRFKFADHAVPELISRVIGLGARPTRLEAVLVGGASMFAVTGSSLEVGQRNDAAVREILAAKRIPVLAAATGGKKGRTIRVDTATGGVTVKEAGAAETQLLEPSRAAEPVA